MVGNKTPLALNHKTGEFRREYRKGVVTSSVEKDVFDLAPRLRTGDLNEIRYAVGKKALTALQDSFANSKLCLTLKDLDGNVAAMFGVSWTTNPRIGKVWLLSSDYLYIVGRPFLLECPSYIELFMQGHDVIFNHVHDQNHASTKWLKWLDFEETAKYPEYGSGKEPFTEYSKFSDINARELYLNRDWRAYLASISSSV